MEPGTRDRAGVSRAPFGTTPAGEPVETLTLTNQTGLEVRLATYGGTIVSLSVPDREGRLADVVLGHDSLEEYVRDSCYFGATIGRFAGRLARGRFTLDGRTYQLTTNNGHNHLHGGHVGFDRVVWRATPFRAERGVGLVLAYASPDGEEGYPGTLNAEARFTLTDQNELMVDFRATTDRPTPVNLTQHPYFNLAGTGDVLEHMLWINADRMTPVDEDLIPTGEIVPVAGGPFDFRSATAIGARIATDHEQLRRGNGYDHNYVLKGFDSDMAHAARLMEPKSGRTLDVFTTEPGLQFYSGNFLNSRVPGKAGRQYGPRSGLALETQHFPDSPNQPAFPSTILRPGEEYRARTIFAFGVTPSPNTR